MTTLKKDGTPSLRGKNQHPPGKRYQAVSFALTGRQIDWVYQYAQRNGMSGSEVVRKALDFYSMEVAGW